MAVKKAGGGRAARAGFPKRRKRPDPSSVGLAPKDVTAEPPPEIASLARMVTADGGAPIAPYRDPLGGHWLLLAALPIAQVTPTVFQRDLSETHAQRLREVMQRLDRYLDPVIAVRSGSCQYQTPNGNHRLGAMRALGAKSITALVVPETEVAFKILALNVEKAHNLREKSLEVIRMYRELSRTPEFSRKTEDEFDLEFEDPAFCTLGACYERQGRFGGGAYQAVLKRCELWLERPLPESLARREARAVALLELDAEVMARVQELKARGLESPYLKNFVVARVNPIRFQRGASMPADALIAKMTESAKKLDVSKIKPGDVAKSGGPPSE